MSVLRRLSTSGIKSVPLILQNESAECGLASLAMVANAHGAGLSLVELRSRFSFSTKGATVRRLLDVANEIGFRGRAIRIELDDLRLIPIPCILHWDFSHFIVLESTNKDGVIVLDPAKGRRRVAWREAGEHFTGIAIELLPKNGFVPVVARATKTKLNEVTGTVRGLLPSGIAVMALSVALQLFVLAAPLYLQWVIDQVLVANDVDLLTVLALSFATLVILEAAFSASRGWLLAFVSSSALVQWNGNVFSHLLRLPMAWFEKRQLGDVISRKGATQAIQRTLSTSFVEALIDGVMALVTLLLMVLYSWQLTLVAITALAIYAAFQAVLFAHLRQATEQSLVRSARVNTHLIETIRGVQAVRILGGEGVRLAQLENFLIDATRSDLHVAKLRVSATTANTVLFGLERVVVIWIGALAVLVGNISLGMLVAYLAYKELFARRAMSLVDKLQELRMLGLHVDRLSDIVKTPAESGVARGAGANLADHSVEFLSVSFRYSDSDPWVLHDCSFRIESGECVALTGPSGCGKSTLAKLFLGLLQPTVGVVKIGGVDIAHLSTSLLREELSAVMQEDQLFSGSIAENISFFGQDNDMDRVVEAAAMAGLAGEIEAMPMRYHTLVGDLGSSLSGGQRQRLVLARALYRKPKILLLDEATSHLDIRNEATVNEAIHGLSLTRFVIAHRPQTIESADRVLELKQGKVKPRTQGSREAE